MRIRLLGAVRATHRRVPVDLGPRNQRLVLALLALEVNRQLPVERLVDLVWPDKPPRTAEHAIRVAVSGLRAAFAKAGLSDEDAHLATEGAGYALRMDPLRIDAYAFRQGLAAARETAGDAQRLELLDRALGLWSGDPLSGTASEQTQRALCEGLREAYLVGVEDRFGALLRLGRHEEVLAEIPAVVGAHPLRERLAAHLMLALYRSGRPDAALAAYQEVRRRLEDQLGLDPGVELRELELAVLRRDPALAPPRPATPAQLPATVVGFTGRADVLSELDGLAGGGIAAVVGAAGVGKTALAVHWAQARRDRFPDGQLYADLGGYGPDGPLPPARVLAGFLRALGIAAQDIPADAAEAAGLYRTRLAGKALLVVLDNAASAEQVRPLLPPPPVAMVLTSRDRLDGLAAREGARVIGLPMLTAAEAYALMGRLIGEERVAAEPQAASDLVQLCGFLPLAVRIAAADLNRHPRQSLAAQADRLREGDRLALLSVAGDERSRLDAAFGASYATLPEVEQRLFRLVGAAPGPRIGIAAAAALAGLSADVTRRALAGLTRAHLLDEPDADRFAIHDLLRLYAQSRAASGDAVSLALLLESYLDSARAAAEVLYPQMQRLPGSSASTAFADAASAMAWLDVERPQLVAAVAHAARTGPREYAWQLADALRGYFWMSRHAADWLATAESGLCAAAEADDPHGQAACHLSLAQAHRLLGRPELAVEHLRQARISAAAADWPPGEAAALGSLANLYRDLGRLADAAEQYRLAGDLFRRGGNSAGETVNAGNLGNVLLESGRLREGIEHLTLALAGYRTMGAVNGQAHVLNSIGCAYHALGEIPAALDHLGLALELHRQAGSREGEADTLTNLAEVHADSGTLPLAVDLASTGLELAQQAGDRRVEVDATNALATARRRCGDLAAARSGHRQALLSAREAGYSRGETIALLGLAALGSTVDAEAALEIARRGGYRMLECDALEALARPAEAEAIRAETGYRRR